jgi:hypothetical protein
MTTKQSALLNTAAILIVSILLGVGAAFLFTFFSFGQILAGYCILMLVFSIKMVYDIEVIKAEMLKEMKEYI